MNYDVLGESEAEAVAKGLRMLEDNWHGFIALKQARQVSLETAIQRAKATLAQIDSNPPAFEYSSRIQALGADLFKSYAYVRYLVQSDYEPEGPCRAIALLGPSS